jgi:SecD/SecF fusion protein
MCDRVDALGTSGVGVRRRGTAEIELQSGHELDPSQITPIASTARLEFYDWEPNVLGPYPNAPIVSLFRAATLASGQRPRAEATDIPPGGPSPAVRRRFGGDTKKIEAYYDRANDTAGDKYYAFGSDGSPLGPAPYYASRKEAPHGSKVVKVPRGIVLLKAEAGGASSASSLGYWVLEDDAELSGADIVDPKQQVDPQTNEPIVTFEFTAAGRAAFARATKREAERGAQLLAPPGTPNDQKFQRFAIALDNQIVSLATVSFVDNPEGIDGSTGAQVNGIGSLRDTQALAKSLQIGALPVTLRLERVEP